MTTKSTRIDRDPFREYGKTSEWIRASAHEPTKHDQRQPEAEAQDWPSSARRRSTEPDRHPEAHQGGARYDSRRGSQAGSADHCLELVPRSRPGAAGPWRTGEEARAKVNAASNRSRTARHRSRTANMPSVADAPRPTLGETGQIFVTHEIG